MINRRDFLKKINGCNRFDLTDKEVRNYFLIIQNYIQESVNMHCKPGQYADLTISERQQVCFSNAIRELFEHNSVQALHETYDIISNYNTDVASITYNEYTIINEVINVYNLTQQLNIELSMLKTKVESDGYTDYKIYLGNEEIGVLQTIEDDDKDYIFIRQIRIYESVQRLGIGHRIIDNIVSRSTKKIRFCIATNSDKAIKFWNKYLSNTKFNKVGIKEHTWEIWK